VTALQNTRETSDHLLNVNLVLMIRIWSYNWIFNNNFIQG